MNTWIVIVLIMAAAPWIIKVLVPHEIRKEEVFISMAVACLSFTLFFFLGKYSQTLDYEVWSGAVTDKKREHGSYVRTYSCNCREVCSGSGSSRSCSQQCDTCYEDRYTVTWDALSTIGSFRIDSLDSGSRAVYYRPDPQRYVEIKQGDPVAKKVSFTNYVKAVPESVFRGKIVEEQFASLIPNYPDKIFDIYKVNRVLSMGVNVSDLAVWNMSLSYLMCELGTQAKANVIIVFVGTEDHAYVESLKAAWLNGKKNDVVVVFGMTQYPDVKWVEVFGWSDQELFKIELADELRTQKEVNIYSTLDIIKKHVLASFKYKDMEDFAYLESAIEPPLWLTVLACIMSVVLSLGSVLFFRHKMRR